MVDRLAHVLCSGVLAALLLVAPSIAAGAGGSDSAAKRAQSLFQRAEAHYSRGEFREALPLYLEAHRAKPLPELLFNVGQCYRHLGEHERAVFYYQQFLEQKPRTPQRAQVQQLIEDSRAADARQRGRAPRPEPAGSGTSGGGTSGGGTSGGVSERTTRVLFWSGVGLAGALVLTGAITGGVAHGQDSEYAAPGTNSARRQEISRSRQRLESASWACLGLAATAGIGTALVLYLTSAAPAKAARQTSSVSLAPVLLGTGGGLLVDGRF